MLLIGVFLLLLVTFLFSLYAYPLLQSWGGVSAQTRGEFVLQSLALAAVIALLGTLYLNMYFESVSRVKAQASAELMALHAQIRPHFLFNCLNTVAELIHHSTDDAERATLNLAALFRAALHVDGRSSLADELELARRYVELEQWRLGSRLTIEWILPEILPTIAMPVLTIQPLIENAIRHGVEPLSHGGHVQVKVIKGRQWLTLLITNPVSDTVTPEGAGIALTNIERRLQLWFSEHAHMTAGIHQGVYRIKLTLPLEIT